LRWRTCGLGRGFSGLVGIINEYTVVLEAWLVPNVILRFGFSDPSGIINSSECTMVLEDRLDLRVMLRVGARLTKG